MFWAIYGAVLFASWAMMVREGLWSNLISLLCIVFSGLLAFGFYSPLVVRLDEMTGGQNTYWLDFVVIWALFIVTMIVLKVVTRLASGTRLRFKNPIDPVGGPLVGLLAAWLLVAFVTATLHTSPMPADAFGGNLLLTDEEKDTESLSGWALTRPDVAWLKFVETASAPSAFGSSGTSKFNAFSFVKIYEDHRTKFSKAAGLRVQRR